MPDPGIDGARHLAWPGVNIMHVARAQAVPIGAFLPSPIPAVHETSAGSCIDQVVAELASSAKLTCVTANVAMALEQKRRGVSVEMLSRYLPPQPTAFPASISDIAIGSGGDDLIRCLNVYFDQIRFLCGLTEWYCKAVQYAAPHLPTDIDTLAASWQGATTSASRALKCLEALDIIDPCASSAERMHGLALLLEATRQGDTPCLSDTGQLAVSIAPENRKMARIHASRQIYVDAKHSIQRALIIDASPSGLGLWGVRNVDAGDDVRIIWKPGVTISGKIIWAEEQRCGLQFGSGLPPGSNLICDLMATGAD